MGRAAVNGRYARDGDAAFVERLKLESPLLGAPATVVAAQQPLPVRQQQRRPRLGPPLAFAFGAAAAAHAPHDGRERRVAPRRRLLDLGTAHVP
eukprot:46072-Prymnesium_polylepis.1